MCQLPFSPAHSWSGPVTVITTPVIPASSPAPPAFATVGPGATARSRSPRPGRATTDDLCGIRSYFHARDHRLIPLLANNCRFHGLVRFKPNETLDPVALCATHERYLPDAAEYGRAGLGNAGVESTVGCPSEDVDAWLVFHRGNEEQGGSRIKSGMTAVPGPAPAASRTTAIPLPFFQKPTSNSGAVCVIGREPAAEIGFGGEERGRAGTHSLVI